MKKRYDVKIVEANGEITEIYLDVEIDRAKEFADEVKAKYKNGNSKLVAVFDGEELVHKA